MRLYLRTKPFSKRTYSFRDADGDERWYAERRGRQYHVFNGKGEEAAVVRHVFRWSAPARIAIELGGRCYDVEDRPEFFRTDIQFTGLPLRFEGSLFRYAGYDAGREVMRMTPHMFSPNELEIGAAKEEALCVCAALALHFLLQLRNESVG